MARVSGLASDHHPQSSGDVPQSRRKKTGSKRAASPTGETSHTRRKRVHIDDHDQLDREMEDSVSRGNSDTVVVATKRGHSEPPVPAQEDDSQLTQLSSTQPLPARNPRGRPSKASRATRASVPAQFTHADEELEHSDSRELQFAPFKAILRRRDRRRLRRSHVSEEMNTIEQNAKEDKKLRQAYARLQAQLQDKEKAILSLKTQLEARLLGELDISEDRAEELEQELAQAREEIEDLRRSSLYTGANREPSPFSGAEDDGDEEMLVIETNELGGPAQVVASPLPTGPYADRALALSHEVTTTSLATITETSYDVLADSTPGASNPVPDRISDQAVHRYESEIERLVQSNAEAQGALRVIAIGLQNLNVVSPGASTDTIVEQLRHDFEALREEMENLMPSCTVGLTNSAFIRKVPTLFEGALTELREKVLSAQKEYQEKHVFRNQYEHLLDLVGRAEEQNGRLGQQVNELETANAAMEMKIDELQTHIQTLTTELDDQDTQLNNQAAEINGLKDEVDDKDTALARIQASLNAYQADLNALTVTTTRLEEDHRDALLNMENAQTEIVSQLQTQLGDEMEGRTIAENDAMEKKEYIDDLERSVAGLESEFTIIKDNLGQLRDRLATETELRQTAEEDRDTQTNLAYDQANQIENLEETVQDVKAQLADVKAYLETERIQRQETETALDAANEQITALSDQLRNAGIQANELRSKLFEAQQEREQAIADLEADAQELAELNQAQLDAEVENRDNAEKEVDRLNDEVAKLEKEVTVMDANINEMTVTRTQLEKDRDEQIAVLDLQLTDLRQKHAALENSSTSAITTLQANITDLTNEVNAKRAELDSVTAEALQNDKNLREELGEKEQEIASLTADLGDADNQISQLQQNNRSLSSRVEEGAVEILRITDAHAQETGHLRQTIAVQANTINTLNDTINDLNAKATLRHSEHKEWVEKKEMELEELTMEGVARATHIVELKNQIEVMKETFRIAEEDTAATIDILTERQRQLQQENEALADDLKKRNADRLKTIQETDVKGVTVSKSPGANVSLNRGKVTKVSEKITTAKKTGSKKKSGMFSRSWRDSGFGAATEDEYEENVEMEEPVF
jgi:chromosome segregation ATPase